MNRFFQHTAVKESLPIVIGQGASFVGTLASLRLATGALSVETFGLVMLGLTVIGLQSLVCGAPISASAGRLFAVAKEARQLWPFYHALTKVFYVTVLIALLLGIGGQLLDLFGLHVHELFHYLILLTCIGAFICASSAVDSILTAARYRWRAAFMRAFDPWTKVGAAAAGALLLGPGLIHAFLGMLAGTFAGMLIRLYMLRSVSTGEASIAVYENQAQPWERKIIDFGLPYLSWGWANWLWSASDRWSLETFQSSGAVAHYAVLYQLGFASLLALFGPINQLIQPHVYARAGDASLEHRRIAGGRLVLKVIGVTALVGIIVTGIFSFFSHQIVAWCAAPIYQEYAYLLPVFGAAAALFGIAQNLEVFHLLELNAKAIALPKILFYLVASLLNILVAAYGNLHALAWLQLFHSILYALMLTVMSRGQLRSLFNRQ